jgi:eukaryotic-like serine/threonine-protein kinase
VARALMFIHAEGVVHADLSPRNVILKDGITPVLIDFGTALSVRTARSAREIAQEEGLVAGTVAYMAPERLRGEQVDARCDLYSLGCILFQLMTGAPPPPPEARHGPAGDAITGRLTDVPPEIRQLLTRLLEHAPEDRLGHAAEVAVVLERALGREPDATGLPRPPLYRPRLRGRADEARALLARIDALALEGRGARLLISGESGIGKTRLLNDVGRLARSRDLEVVVGSTADVSTEAGLGGAPLALFRPFLRRLGDRWSGGAGPPVAPGVREALDVLAALDTDLQAIAGVDPGRPLPLPPGPGRRRVLASLRRLMQVDSQRKPSLFLLDDLHLADELTLAFLESLEVPADAPGGTDAFLLIGTYRSEEEGPAVARLAGMSPDQRLALKRLALDDVRAMSREMLGAQRLPEGLPELLHRRSGGNPFLAAEYLRRLVDEDVLRWSAVSGWSPTRALDSGEDAADEPAPDAVAALFRRRLQGLSQRALQLLELAVVLGHEWSGSRLRAVAQASRQAPAASSEALDELVAARILEASAPDRYRFVHDQLRALQARALAPDRSRALHRQLAEALERAPAAEGGTAQLGAIGQHWAAAGEPLRAFPHLVQGAAQAEASYAHERAVELYRLAALQARVLPADDPDRPAKLGRTCEALGDLLVRLARHDEARLRFAEALALVEGRSAFPAARLHRKIGESHWTVHEYQQAAPHIREADRLLGPREALRTVEQKQEWIAIHYGDLAIRYYARQTGPETLALIRKLEPVVEEAGTALQRTLFYQSAASELLGRTRYAFSPEAVSWAEKALAATEQQAAADEQRSEAFHSLGFALLWGGPQEIAAAVGWLDRAVEAARQVEDRSLAARSLTYLLIACRRSRDLERTEELADVVQTSSEAARLTPYLAVAEACRGWLSLHRGDIEGARAGARRARALWQSSAHVYPFRWLGLFVEMAVARDREQPTEIRTLAGELLASDQQQLPPAPEAVLARIRDSDGPVPADWNEALRLAVDLRFL